MARSIPCRAVQHLQAERETRQQGICLGGNRTRLALFYARFDNRIAIAFLQSTARIRYTLTDSDLKPLGSLRKANPHRKDWQPMHLYMQSQVGQER